jgi:hypothetical protein
MDENINFIRNLSLGVLILGLLLLVVAILIFWKFDLLDYYRFKTGKKMKKTNSTSQSTVSQYYSEQLASDDSHEIINQDYYSDSGDLEEKVEEIGQIKEGVVSQVIADDTVQDFTTYLGVEDTTVLPKEEAKVYLDPNGENDTTILGYTNEQQEVQNGSEDTTVLEENLDETDIVELPKIEEVQEDETGSEETQVLASDENLDETDVVELTSLRLYLENQEKLLGRSMTTAEKRLAEMEYEDSNHSNIPAMTVPIADEGSEDTEVLQKTETVVEVDDPTEELAPIFSSNVTPTSQEESSPTLDVKAEESILFETEGEEETTVLSNKELDGEAASSTKLWSGQTSKFKVQKQEEIIVYGK